MQTVSQTQIFSLLSWMLFAPHRGFPSPGSDVYYPSVKEDASADNNKSHVRCKIKVCSYFGDWPWTAGSSGISLGEERKVSRLQRYEKVKTVDWNWRCIRSPLEGHSRNLEINAQILPICSVQHIYLHIHMCLLRLHQNFSHTPQKHIHKHPAAWFLQHLQIFF